MDKIIIVDFGSQVAQLIGRRLRELNVYCELHPFDKVPAPDPSVKGVILSGSPCSVRDANAPQVDLTPFRGVPILGICYGAQYIAHIGGGKVEPSNTREYGRAILKVVEPGPLFKGVSRETQVWMSHGDTIAALPKGAQVTASTADVTNAAYQIADWFPLPYDFLRDVSNEIIRKVRGVNRVVYDISSKPPATIEWE